jgi:hypothetical protein
MFDLVKPCQTLTSDEKLLNTKVLELIKIYILYIGLFFLLRKHL